MFSASIIVVPYEDDSFLANPFFKANNSMMMHKIGTELSLDFQWGHRVNMLNYFFDSSQQQFSMNAPPASINWY